MGTIKTFKSATKAYEAANGKPLIRVGSGESATYLLIDDTNGGIRLTDIAVIDTKSGQIVGNVGVGHLARLGNANHATPGKGWENRCTPGFLRDEPAAEQAADDTVDAPTLLSSLKGQAADRMALYPQYDGYFDTYVLVQVVRDIRTKLGLAFQRGEYAIMKPIDPLSLDRDVTVWSTRNASNTGIPRAAIQIVIDDTVPRSSVRYATETAGA